MDQDKMNNVVDAILSVMCGLSMWLLIILVIWIFWAATPPQSSAEADAEAERLERMGVAPCAR